MYGEFLVDDVFNDNLNNRTERVLWISEDYKQCYTIDVFSNKIDIFKRSLKDLILDLENKDIELLLEDPTVKIISEDELKDKSKELRDKAFEIINFIIDLVGEPNIFNNKHRRRGVLEAKEKFGVSSKTIYKYFRIFYQGGKKKNSLVPMLNKCGGPGKFRSGKGVKYGRPSNKSYLEGDRIGINVNDEIRRIFSVAHKRNIDKKLTESYKEMKTDFFSKKVLEEGEIKKYPLPQCEIPTFRQYQYWVKKNTNQIENIKSEVGNKKFESNYRGLNSSSISETFGPGSRYQIDATIADVYLVNRIDRNSIIGRPVVYIVIDVFSRLVTGLHVALEGPSWNGASTALYNCIEDKIKFCEKFGITISKDEWPAIGLPQALLGDRGELVGPLAENTIHNLRIEIENTSSYRGDAKGLVEQYFNTINTKIKQYVPGAIKKDFNQRGAQDYRLDAILDIEQFTKLIIQLVLERNKRYLKNYVLTEEMIRDGVKPIPIELWNWGIKNISGKLRRLPERLTKLNLMRRGKASITARGIQFKQMLYTSDIALKEGWLTHARINGVQYRPIAYDARDTSIIYVIDEDEDRIIECNLRQEYEAFKGKYYEEPEDYNFMKKIVETDYIDEQNKNDFQLAQALGDIVKEAEEKKSKDSRSNREKISKVNENRKNENASYSKEQSLTNIDKKGVADKKNNKETCSKNSYSENKINELRNYRNKGREI